MSTILIYTSPARGHLYPMMDVALALRDAGHRVVVQTLAAERDTVGATGLEHHPISDAIEQLPLEDYHGSNPLEQLKRTFACWLTRAPHEVADLRASMEAFAPDLLLIDVNTWGAAAFAESAGTPWAMFLPYCLPTPSRDAPAFGPGFKPPRGPLGRMRDGAFRRLLGMVSRKSIRGLNELRSELGVASLPGMMSLYDRAEILLYRTAEPFDYPRRDWPACVRAIGPGLWSPPGTEPEWLGSLPRPRILVSVSTELQEDGAIIETALEALRDESGSVIVTTAALDPQQFTAPHERVKITRFLSHAAVVPQLDLVVTHGGMGTTQRALAAGVPVCVVPWGRDQLESARRVEVSGAGRFVPRNKLTPQRLREAVHQAKACRPGAVRVAQAFQEAGGATRALELLKPWLQQPTANRTAS